MAAGLVYRNVSLIDVSHHNGVINWTAVKRANIPYAFIKATEGASFTDNMFITNWNTARSQNIHVGGYHFYRPDVAYQLQVQNFVSTLGSVNIDTTFNALAIDVEQIGQSSKAKYSDDLFSFIVTLQSRINYIQIFIYTYKTFWNANVDWTRHDFTRYKLWVASYGVSTPSLPGNFTQWNVWQYTSTGQVPGIQGSVDKNYMRL